uniref:Uncharacterized protein n=1 Tax=Globodera pallida TaxID=36090 RepID=A0A183CEU5_GLOPA
MLYSQQQQQFAQPFLQAAPNPNQHQPMPVQMPTNPQLLPQQQQQYSPMQMNHDLVKMIWVTITNTTSEFCKC